MTFNLPVFLQFDDVYWSGTEQVVTPAVVNIANIQEMVPAKLCTNEMGTEVIMQGGRLIRAIQPMYAVREMLDRARRKFADNQQEIERGVGAIMFKDGSSLIVTVRPEFIAAMRALRNAAIIKKAESIGYSLGDFLLREEGRLYSEEEVQTAYLLSVLDRKFGPKQNEFFGKDVITIMDARRLRKELRDEGRKALGEGWDAAIEQAHKNIAAYEAPVEQEPSEEV